MGRLCQIGSVRGLSRTPIRAGSLPTVIVIQEWWGLDNQTESIVTASPAALSAFAPDLYHGELALLGDSDKAMTLAQKYGPTAPQDLFKTFDALKTHADSSGKIGSVGFCFGGRMSLVLGANRLFDAICTFYGGGMQQVFDQLTNLKAPVLGLYGDQDKSIPKGTIEEIR